MSQETKIRLPKICGRKVKDSVKREKQKSFRKKKKHLKDESREKKYLCKLFIYLFK
jgi:hypothetical protein